jgi:hypothetical protein
MWRVAHAILSIIIIIFGFFALQRFIIALGKFLAQVFLYTLQAPVRFGNFVLGLCLKPLGMLRFRKGAIEGDQANSLVLNSAIPRSVSVNKKERLVYIMKRLEALGHEQNQLLQEVT